MLWMTWTAEARTSPTADELGHLVRGLGWWWAPDTRMSWPHPPLAHAVVTAPSALLDDEVAIDKLKGFARADFPRVALSYADRDYPRMRAQLTSARRVMMVGAVLLGGWLYTWLRRRQGTHVALAGLLLYASHTVILGEATLLTTDFPFAACALIASLKLADYLRSPRLASVFPVALALGCGLAIKHTGLVFTAIVVAVAVVWAVAGRGRFALPPARRLGRLLRDGAILLATSLLVINAAYKFQGTGMTVAEIHAAREPKSWMDGKVERLFDDDSPLHLLPPSTPVPLPYPYLFGVMFVRAQNAIGHQTFFLGERLPSGHSAYFPLLWLVKTPLGMLTLLLAGLGARVMGVRFAFHGALCLWLAAAFLLVASRSHINLGFRHALVLPMLSVVIAADAVRMITHSARWCELRMALVAAGLAACVAGALAVRPLFLGDFNLLAGGRSGGLAISVIGEDWLQDVGDLARRVRADGLQPLAYFSSATTPRYELTHLGVRFERLGCGKPPPRDAWVAVHVRDRLMRPRCLGSLQRREPDLVINDHVLLFRPRAR
jgi:hypothetical protein